MKIIFIFIFIFSLLFAKISFSQTIYDYGFKKTNNISVRDSTGKILRHAWVGGLNSCQFSDIDLNNDGISDLFVFDKTGNKSLTFINNGISDSVDYIYNYYFQKYFSSVSRLNS